MDLFPLILLLAGNSSHSNIKDDVVSSGSNFTLVCGIPGSVWKHPVKESSRIYQNKTQNGTSITIINSEISDRGIYECSDPTIPKIHASKLVYVFDGEKLLVGNQVMRKIGEKEYLVPCLITHPAVKVTLESFPDAVYDTKEGFTLKSKTPDGLPPLKVTCSAQYQDLNTKMTVMWSKRKPTAIVYVHEGKNVTLTCKIRTEPQKIHNIKWTLPNSKIPRKTEGVTIDIHSEGDGKRNIYDMYKDLIIHSAKKDDEGEYTCHNNFYRLIVLGKDEDPFLNVTLRKDVVSVSHTDGSVNFIADYKASLRPNFTWFDPHGNVIKPNEKYGITTTDDYSLLNIYQLTASDAGSYSLTVGVNKKLENYSVTLNVIFSPIVKMKQISHNLPLNEFYNLTCNVYAFPKANISWIFEKCTSTGVCDKNETIEVMQARKENDTIISPWKAIAPGKITCKADNLVGTSSDYISFGVHDFSPPMKSPTIGAIIAVLVLLILVVITLAIKMVQDKKKMNKLTSREIAAFHEGTLSRINPDLEIDEQAHLLPYNKCFEFPREKLTLGKQLGNGAFGVVVKAEAEGIIEDEPTTTVAVKMVKSQADVSHLRALMTELKILMYIGQHLNVLNLLGACTLNLIQKELLVIVEYCRFGNLHSYMHRHRDSFVNQIDPVSKYLDFSIGKGRGSVSMNPAGDPPLSPSYRSAYSKSSGIQLPPSFTGETVLSFKEDSMSSNCSSQFLNQWNVMYKNDAENVVADPINTKDLLSWSYQVAMGMDYLSKRKIVHADLASRNILLADNNVIKICDFGLARPLYGKMNYQKKGKDPLPIKWMAIESLEYKIFSSKSDAWSFGIVLWEIFSLGKSPYPGVEVSEDFLEKLLDGYRMAKPEFCPDEIIMMECWDPKPDNRPKFSELSGRIGSMLDRDTKENYQEMSAQYEIKGEASRAYYENWMRERDTMNEYLPLTSHEREYVNCNVEEAELRNPFKHRNYVNVPLSESSDYLPMSIKSGSEA